jgi:NAD(P)-dependent dehydrogenase (short-subunit alcohol dehydrogenase family)
MDLFNLTGTHALITGAGGGIGRALASGFAACGADVACVDLSEEFAKPGVDAVFRAGRRAIPVACDVKEPEAVKIAVARTLQCFGKIDILVNLAGSGILKPALEFTLTDWNHMVDTYLRGTFLFCQEVGAHMIKRGSGSIINISSIASLVALGRGTAPYAAVKAGVNALTRELAVEWATKGIRVNAIAPCQIDTPQLRALFDNPQFTQHGLMTSWLENIAMKRLGRPDELVGPAIFLASNASSLVTGHILVVDGGYTLK